MEKLTDGHQTRLATTDEFLHIAEKASGKKLDWFFEVYLRQPKLPELITEIGDKQITLRWEVPAGLKFPMPVEVQVGDSLKRYEMTHDTITIPIEAGAKVTVDPKGWILKTQ
jgi:aminopeptidase N